MTSDEAIRPVRLMTNNAQRTSSAWPAWPPRPGAAPSADRRRCVGLVACQRPAVAAREPVLDCHNCHSMRRRHRARGPASLAAGLVVARREGLGHLVAKPGQPVVTAPAGMPVDVLDELAAVVPRDLAEDEASPGRPPRSNAAREQRDEAGAPDEPRQ